MKITGVQNEVPYDGSHYVMQENPVLEDLDVLLAENEKEILLLELFPTVARTFLTKWKEQKSEIDCLIVESPQIWHPSSIICTLRLNGDTKRLSEW